MAGTRSASSDERVWVVPAALRTTFAEKYGPVYAGKDAEDRLRGLRLFGACGDRVTASAIAVGNLPLIGIVDFKTRRNEPVDPATFAPLAARRRVRVKNPAGMLTERLRTAVRELVDAGGGLVEVEGEEDLGALALVESLPLGATVIYGIPGEGVSFVSVDAVAKDHVQQLVARMELRRLDLGP
ncbi:MAG TPA: DUF359 domain-containing protein [Thermoplasmata archaeon]